ncbi:MAG: mercuric reductase [Longimicrobiales bacterium]|nr:mercuric reductase [Longimicrobiales bacterium]
MGPALRTPILKKIPMSTSFQAVSDADRRLLDLVSPPDWTNPTPRERYDLAVVGGGTGGLVSAAIGAALGARVALVERALMGGDCLNYGCVPSKAVLRAARSWAEARESADRFAGPAVAGEGSFAAALERMRTLRADIGHVDGAARFRDLGVDVYFGDASFVAEDALEVAGARLTFRRAILATGARAAVPPIPGLAEAGFLTNENVFSLRERPDHLLVLGAGAIGCELAQAFARFGSRVTLLEMEDRPIPREEPGASEVLLRALERDGVDFLGGARVTRVESGPAGKVVTWEPAGADGSAPRTVAGDALLVAVGRQANLDVGLEEAGVRVHARGVEVDDRLRTSNRRIYAVGDVATPYQFTHVADAHARLAVRNALFFGRGKVSDLIIPAATYTSPEVARVGPTVAELRAGGEEVETLTVSFDDVDRARLDGEDQGFLSVHLRAGSDTILGATLVWAHAGDVISQLTQAMHLEVGLEKLGDLIYPYPTTAEAIRKAADQYRRRRLTPRAKGFFRRFFQVSRLLP